ncbi:hypothetical protein [Williamsoniiplasma luminosum]|uniref:FAD synthase n=1 Tax=Williamsoniiplasma luminosum TaxID=214888 RepID=A0A2S0NJ74_9MOLU|nr:hypothetical protein [Williamsoniiplasma luminosum]AVP49070.1 MAG: hypothetical protein C5T88_00520 [Williamsoniiplasma luminosum]
MKIFQETIQNLQNLNQTQNSIVVIGYFDGLHKYHQQILNKAKQLSMKQKKPFIFVTFDQKIGNFLKNEKHDLISQTTKIKLVTQYNPDMYIELKVDDYLVNYSKEQFIRWLKNILLADTLVVGQDFKFGARAMGDVDTLIEYFSVKQIIVFKRNNIISSQEIRELVNQGEIQKINKQLKRCLEIEFENKDNEIWIKYPQSKFMNGTYQISNQDNEKFEITINENNRITCDLSQEQLLNDHWQILLKK